MVEKWNSISDIDSPKNDTVFNNLVKAYSIINRATYNKIMVSISGGSDSDIILDICYKCDRDNKCEYIWFDTGLEYDATKRHLRYLEKKYGIAFHCLNSLSKNQKFLYRPYKGFSVGFH